MRAGPKHRYTVEELVTAYELSTEGVPWYRIRRHLGSGIRDAVNRAKRTGLGSHYEKATRPAAYGSTS